MPMDKNKMVAREKASTRNVLAQKRGEQKKEGGNTTGKLVGQKKTSTEPNKKGGTAPFAQFTKCREWGGKPYVCEALGGGNGFRK